MSRSIRCKSPQTPMKKKSRPTSRNTDNSSDDDYAGVDLVSDDDDESEPDVEGVEEQAIIDSEADDEDEGDHDETPRPRYANDETSWEGFESTQDAEPSETFFDEHMARTSPPERDAEAAIWNTTNSSVSEDIGTPGRRVHFDLSDSDEGEIDMEDTFFPDIFLDQNQLDPGFRRALERDDDDTLDSDWDYDGSDNSRTPHKAHPQKDRDQSDSDQSTGSSGYESDSDEGLTTDEDLPPESKFAPAKSVLRRMSETDDDEDEEEITVHRRGPLPGPRLGSWVLDRSKPFAVMNKDGKKLIMFQATVKRRVSFNGNPTAPGQLGPSAPIIEQHSPMISNSGDLMLSAMYTNLDQFSGSALGPPEAFHPFTDIAVDGTVTRDTTSSSLDDSDVGEFGHNINLEDFISFGDGSSDEEGNVDDQDPSPSSDAGDIFSTPARPTTAGSEIQSSAQAHPLLVHFEKNGVGAFRRNQTRHNQLTRDAISSDALAFSGPFGQGPLKGIKGGRLAAANVPITPMRKKRAPAQPLGSSPGSPLANAASNSKRKFDGEQFGHKRSRSAI
ncbi:hypothetical protein BJ875DRAFT_197986 [Amylocarpus encephaloides]|uniref:Uncharacterized protein n=1 Tax=Amylocarpus encephaloides TaxID=45428 RepID=A0A9P7YAF3_9HELO|nr:hypothetical protein BJ875DRAFT_197986 [Amylocarpus encephaloides]